MDSDHKRLIQGLNDLETALAGGQGSRKVTSLLQFLDSYAKEHFAREESCMNRHSCPMAAANKTAHALFSAKISSAMARIEASPGSGALVAIQLHRELCDWIVNHVLKIDSALKGCVKAPAAAKS